MMPVPNGLSPDLAALTEPMAVGLHAIHRGDVKKSDVAVVIGCGPVGLAIICLLKARGVQTIIASDFSPGRRRLASTCGAHMVVDPAVDSPYAHWGQFGFIKDVPATLELMVSTREKLGRLPLPWWHAWRLAEKLAGDPKGPVVFECVGAPGVLQNIIEGVPQFARIVVVGVCMQSDRIENAVAINKALQIRFSAGYSPLEFRDTKRYRRAGFTGAKVQRMTVRASLIHVGTMIKIGANRLCGLTAVEEPQMLANARPSHGLDMLFEPTNM